MDLPSRHVLYLAKKIGSRAPGSDGEAAAASYVLQTMNDFDIEVDTESFSCWKSDTHGLILIYVLGIAGYILFLANYTLSFAVSAVVFLIFQMETYTWAVVSNLLPRSSASNVLGRVRAAGSRTKRVVLVANYDSARTSPLGLPRAARLYRVIYIASFVSIVLIALLGLIGVLASLAEVKRQTLLLIWLGILPFPFYLLLLVIVLLWGELFGHYSPGASDNAAGVGVMLSVISSIAGNPLENTEVWGVATARGSAGGRGMVNLLRRHRRQLRDAYIINIDHPGRGKMKVFRLEGPMLAFRSNRRLKRYALDIASRSKSLELGKGRCRVKKSDAMVALARRKRAVSIGGLRGGTYPGWRSSDDVYEKVNRKSLDRVVKLIGSMLEEIDNG